MTPNTQRIALLNAVLAIAVATFIAGFPLAWTIARDVYGQTPPWSPPGDHRGWHMAHLEGLLNGLLMIGLVTAVQGRVMMRRIETWWLRSLLLSTWGNTLTPLLIPLLQVRGIAFDGHLANDVVTALFSVALVGTVAAFVLTVRLLWQKDRPVVPL